MFISKVKLIFLVLGLVFVAPHAQADSRATSQPKEDGRFEGEGGFPNVFKWLDENDILNDGILSIGHEALIKDSKTSNAIKVGIETRIHEVCKGQKWSEGSGCVDTNGDSAYLHTLIVPIEVIVRIDVNDAQKLGVDKLRAGVVRLLGDNFPLTAQIGSYVLNRYQHELGTFHGAELAELTFKSASSNVKDGKLAIVLKATARAGFGVLKTSNAFEVGLRNSAEEGVSTSRNGVYAAIGGSLGMRIPRTKVLPFYDQILVDVFGNLDRFGFGRDSGVELSSRTYGAGLRFAFSKYIHLRFSAEKNVYDMKVNYGETAKGSQTIDDKRVNSILEFHY